MNELLVAAGTAWWLGVLTSISPCPLATNIAAISFVSRRLASRRLVVIGGLAYTIGRALAYLLLGMLIVRGLLAVPALSATLQRVMPLLVGPLLILTGMYLLGLLKFEFSGGFQGKKLAARMAGWGVAGEALLGFLFALTFCPISAALFFGSLIPLALALQSGWLLPGLYGVGTALPVLAAALALAFGARSLGLWLNRLRSFEVWAERVTGGLLIALGLYFSVTQVWLRPG